MAKEDIISTLPVEILHKILCFLPTKDAVATTILSKRWNNLHLSLTVLDFKDIIVTDPYACVRFSDAVYSLLVSRDPALPIKAFRFDVNINPTPLIPTFTKLINIVLQRGVVYLNLFLGYPRLQILPNTIFTSKTLVILDLAFFRLDHEFSSFQLPSLKTLHLQLINFPTYQNFVMLLTGCPILENLLIAKLCFESPYSRICDEWKNFSLSNLTEAEVDSSYFHFTLKSLHNVHSLWISIAEVRYFYNILPTFHNLTYLQLSFLNYRWRFLVEILKHCPKLEELDLDEAGEDATEETWTRKDDKENWVDPDFVPECLSLHLRNCNLYNFLGLQGELSLATYILENARVLETMEIWNDGKPEIEMLLSSCPKASSTCELTIHHVPCK